MSSWEAVEKVLDPTSIVPLLTRDDPRVIRSAEIDSAHPAWKLFDRIFNQAGQGYCPVASYPTTYYMGFNFGVATTIDSCTWWYEYANSTIPTAFNLEGSNDLTNWTVIDTFTGYSEWVPLTKYKFYLTAPATYQAFRINITGLRKPGVSNCSYIGEVEFCCASEQQGVDKNLNMPVMII